MQGGGSSSKLSLLFHSFPSVPGFAIIVQRTNLIIKRLISSICLRTAFKESVFVITIVSEYVHKDIKSLVSAG